MAPSHRASHFVIARVVRPRGNRGEVLAELHTDFPTRFSGLHRVWLDFPNGRREPLIIERCWEHRGRQVIKFTGIDSIGEAETLTGAWILVEAENAVSLPQGWYWDHELAGCSLRDSEGRRLGTVLRILRIPGNSQLVVAGEKGEFMVPLVKAICREISVADRTILVELPEGLMDLNP